MEKYSRQILALISEQRDLTLNEMVSALHKRRIPGSRSALSRFFARHGITVKKSLQAAERKRADVARARRRWIREQGFLTPPASYLSTKLQSPPTCCGSTVGAHAESAWSRCADGALGDCDVYRWAASNRHRGSDADQRSHEWRGFLAYIEQCLVPTLNRRDIVVVDNVPFHKVAGVEEAIQPVGASLRYLPQYSPDLNPIELVFHPLKTFLRKAAQRTIEGLHRCVGSYIRTLDPSECMGYFRHSGYEPS